MGGAEFIYLLFLFVSVLLSMSFFTLLERKLLGYFQDRKGPGKVGLAGIPQPFADALKLYSKEPVVLWHANGWMFFLAPLFSLVVSLSLWCLYPHVYPMIIFKNTLLGVLVLSSLSVYGVFVAGWASNSKYALLGSVRSVASTISYEVVMTVLVLVPAVYHSNFGVSAILRNSFIAPVVMLPVLLPVWVVVLLAETNRAPFDMSEGESELVSGFNVEYGGYAFAFIFMAEYLNILVMSVFSSYLFVVSLFPCWLVNLVGVFFTGCFCFIFVWARASLPRMRYDKLMSLSWKTLLPLALGLVFIVVPVILIF